MRGVQSLRNRVWRKSKELEALKVAYHTQALELKSVELECRQWRELALKLGPQLNASERANHDLQEEICSLQERHPAD